MPSRTTWYILAPTLAVSGLLLAAGLSGAWYVHQVNRNVSNSLDDVVAATQSTVRLVLALRDLRVQLHRFINDANASHLDEAESSVVTIEQEVGRNELFDDDGKFGGEPYPDRLSRFREQFQQLRGRETAQADARELLGLLDEELLAPAERVLENRHQMATEVSRQNQAIADRIGLGLLMLGVSGAVAGVLIGFGTARSLRRTLVEITVPVRDIAGRLNEVVGPITVASNTNISDLDGALRVLADKTSDLVKRLQASQQQALRHEQLAAVGQLAAGLAHELRNPLMSVKLIVQTARERAGVSLSERDLAVIEDEVTRLEEMLQMFLDFARPPHPERQVVEICRLIENTIDFVRPRADQQAVQIQYSAPPHELFVDADERQMRQVLLNLLLNALDALPGGGDVDVDVVCDKLPACQNLSVDATRQPQAVARGDGQVADWPHVTIRISDGGPGVAADVIERIFEPFVSTKVTGIGLGLSISRQIVESHQGSIAVRNRAEGGAEFSIKLPIHSFAQREEEPTHADIAGH